MTITVELSGPEADTCIAALADKLQNDFCGHFYIALALNKFFVAIDPELYGKNPMNSEELLDVRRALEEKTGCFLGLKDDAAGADDDDEESDFRDEVPQVQEGSSHSLPKGSSKPVQGTLQISPNVAASK